MLHGIRQSFYHKQVELRSDCPFHANSFPLFLQFSLQAYASSFHIKIFPSCKPIITPWPIAKSASSFPHHSPKPPISKLRHLTLSRHAQRLESRASTIVLAINNGLRIVATEIQTRQLKFIAPVVGWWEGNGSGGVDGVVE